MGLFGGTSHVVNETPNRLGSMTLQKCEFGTKVPDIFGTVRQSTNLIRYCDRNSHRHESSSKSGKGGGVKQTTIWYTYDVYLELAICEGDPDIELSTCWCNGQQYADWGALPEPGTMVSGEFHPDGGVQNYILSKPEDLEHRRTDYHHLAYLSGVCQLGDQTSVPNFEFEVCGKLRSTGDGIDANPADVILYLLRLAGVIPRNADSAVAETYVEGIGSYRTYCAQWDYLISSIPSYDDTIQSLVNSILSATNASMFWSNDRFKIVIHELRTYGSYTPSRELVANLTEDDFLEEGLSYSRKPSSELYNLFTVKYMNRINDYETQTVTYENRSSILQDGINEKSVDAGFFYTEDRAARYAETLAYYDGASRNEFSFKLDWAYAILEPGDLVRLTDSDIGISNQLARVTSVEEDEDGLISVLAVGMPNIETTSPSWSVVHNPYNIISFNGSPDNLRVFLRQLPAPLSGSTGISVVLAAEGIGDQEGGYGGCLIYSSLDDVSYQYERDNRHISRIGSLNDDLSTTSTEMIVQFREDVEFRSVTTHEQSIGRTYMMIDNEVLSYKDVTLTNTGWHFEGLQRGLAGTLVSPHQSGSLVLRLDDDYEVFDIDKSLIGQTLYFKCYPYNQYGKAQVTLDSPRGLSTITHSITPTNIVFPVLGNVYHWVRYREITPGVGTYDLVVYWDAPDNYSRYQQAQLWYYDDADSESPTYRQWVFVDNGYDSATAPQCLIGHTYKYKVVIEDIDGNVQSLDDVSQYEAFITNRQAVPNAPENVGVSVTDRFTVTWDYVTNTDIKYYEVRSDQKVGTLDGLLTRVRDNKADVTVVSRTGTIYVYAVNAQDVYSTPGTYTYNYPEPEAPGALFNIGIRMMSILTTWSVRAIGMKVQLVGASHSTVIESKESYLNIQCEPDVYDVIITLKDYFGYSSKSYSTSGIVISVYIDSSLIEDGSIHIDKVDTVVKDALDKANSAAQEDDLNSLRTVITQDINDANASIAQIIATLNGEDGTTQYTAITQLGDTIQLEVNQLREDMDSLDTTDKLTGEEIVQRINLAPSGVTIQGKLIHITGDTLFDNNVITEGMLQAGAVTASKININNGATQGARIVIYSNQIAVYDENNVLRVLLGVWG